MWKPSWLREEKITIYPTRFQLNFIIIKEQQQLQTLAILGTNFNSFLFAMIIQKLKLLSNNVTLFSLN